MLLLLVALRFIPLHSVEGYIVMINPDMVTSLTARTGDPKLLHHRVRCLIGLTDGRLVSVTETCEAVRKLMEGP